MSGAPLIVGVSGLRGIVGESLTPEVAVRYAGAFGSWLNERVGGASKILVCRDGRAGGQVYLDAAIAGLRAVGCGVVDSGVLMTPTAGFLAVRRGCDGAVIITASHNPQQWNGLKFLVVQDGQASAPDADSARAIIERFEKGEIRYVTDAAEIGSRAHDDPGVCGQHVGEVGAALLRRGLGWDDGARTMRVVVDSVNASGAEAAGTLFRVLKMACVQLHGDGSGIFPHTPEPTAENLAGEGGLCDAVPGLKADVGFAQDPDADRLAIVDENGRYIGEEYTLALCAESVLSARGEGGEDGERQAGRLSHREGGDGKRPVLVANLSTSRMIDDVAARYGGRVVRTPVGEANVVEAMKRLRGEDVVLGGEGNGGVIWPEVVYVRDSLSAMALVLSLMARTGKTVSELVAKIDSYSPGGRGYAIVKRKVPIASKADAVPVVEKVAGFYGGEGGLGSSNRPAVDLQDGVRVDFPDKGAWVHVRASNTEPIMRLIAEAPTRDEAGAILAEVERVIAGE
ncbi:MAG TPA: phosphoglucosamine mutase [Phycisphaerales bacterium]|nr:phosphoglucosamine mutase [Phycisphaerales bacterium]